MDKVSFCKLLVCECVCSVVVCGEEEGGFRREGVGGATVYSPVKLWSVC